MYVSAKRYIHIFSFYIVHTFISSKQFAQDKTDTFKFFNKLLCQLIFNGIENESTTWAKVTW